MINPHSLIVGTATGTEEALTVVVALAALLALLGSVVEALTVAVFVMEPA
jgi:hypothetical protein